MSTPTNVAIGELFVKDIPELACFTTFAELLQALPQYLGVEVPNSITNVVVSNTQPNSSQTTSLWIRISNSGNFLGMYVFAGATWNQIYPVPNQMFRIISTSSSNRSNNPPAGFILVSDSPAYTVSQKSAVTATWHLSTDGVNYDIFDVVFNGFLGFPNY